VPSSIIYLCLLSSAHHLECKWILESWLPYMCVHCLCIWMSCMCEFGCLIFLCVYIYMWFLFVNVYTLNLDTWVFVYVWFSNWMSMFECLVSMHIYNIQCLIVWMPHCQCFKVYLLIIAFFLYVSKFHNMYRCTCICMHCVWFWM
jgi:hypothetical protein